MQDDRDLRAERGRKKMEKAFIFMARLRVPGGVLTPQQWLAAERIARERGNGTLRLTTRQTIQFHGIIKSNLRHAISGLNDAMLDTIAACGDVNRNVIARVNPWQSRVARRRRQDWRSAIGTHLLPKSRAWHEIWIDGEQHSRRRGGRRADLRPHLHAAQVQDRASRCRRTTTSTCSRTTLASSPSNRAAASSATTWSAGGGMGMTHGEPDTFPRTGDVIGFCRPEQAVDSRKRW